ncbi:hypothetical protein NC651_012306 [Populus alba x Populus x berolinensis]|nr:hypothetical protein NC651_012306 [Populus alba x Populus x berolinensis]
MRQMWVWMLLMALAFVNDRSHCCLDEERISLLEIKAWFYHAGAAGSYQLEGWDKEHFNFCNWLRVVCDNTTNRVIELYLSYVNFDAVEDLDLNASLFLPFKELEILDLSGNQLVGGLKNQGFQVLASGLRNLKKLDLSGNKFNDNILSSLSGFSTLKSLYLSRNRFTGTIGLKGFQVLALGFQVLASGLRNLEELYLSDNKFNDSILSFLSGFSILKSLDLSGNRFTRSTGLNGKQAGCVKKRIQISSRSIQTDQQFSSSSKYSRRSRKAATNLKVATDRKSASSQQPTINLKSASRQPPSHYHHLLMFTLEL